MPRILLLHTGGTLAMTGAPLGVANDDFGSQLLDMVPEIGQLATLDSRILYHLDSSDIGPRHWSRLATTIAEERDHFDGFVIIHGTDTMAYTASALAFALEGLDKPVVLTGAQRPLAAVRTDARRNLADAVELATHNIPEVAICFDGLLLRGCASTKSHSREYRAFTSPSCAPLAKLGVDIELAAHIRRPMVPFRCDPRFDHRVVVIHVTPALQPALLEAIIHADTPPAGIILSTFGVGTAPNNEPALAPVVAQATDAGIDVLIVSQSNGTVDLGLYINSRPLADAGAIPGGRMRIEAASAKFMHALATLEDRGARRRYLIWNVAGEMG